MFNQNEQVKQLTPEQQAVKDNLWDIMSFDRDGQVKAGEVDRSQEEFLKHTEWTK
jgi:hypothetical protein